MEVAPVLNDHAWGEIDGAINRSTSCSVGIHLNAVFLSKRLGEKEEPVD